LCKIVEFDGGVILVAFNVYRGNTEVGGNGVTDAIDHVKMFIGRGYDWVPYVVKTGMETGEVVARNKQSESVGLKVPFGYKILDTDDACEYAK
jgi:hypothetical protein